MKYFIVLIILGLSFLKVDAQQDTHYTGYMFNTLVINPAYAGSLPVPRAMVYYRHQWADIAEAPRDISLSFHTPLKENVGLGLYAENDQIGVHNRLRIFGSYAYQLRTDFGDLALGIQAGGLYYSSNFTEVENLIDPDDVIYSQNRSRFLPNVGVGLFFYTNNTYIGLSVPHLLNNDILDESISKLSPEARHYFLSGGTVLDLAKDIKLKPSAMVKVVPTEAPFSLDLNLSFILKEQFVLGVAHRLTESVSGFLTYYFDNNLQLGYVYDYPLINLNGVSGSHEVFVGFDFVGSNKGERIVSPRFF